MSLHATPDELKTLVVDQLEIMDEASFEKVRTAAVHQRLPIEQALVERGNIPLSFLLEQLALLWEVGFIDLRMNDIDPQVFRTVPEKFARAHTLIPMAIKDGKLHTAMWNPRDQQVISDLERLTRHGIMPYLAPDHAIRRAHLLYRGDLRALMEQVTRSQTQPGSGHHWPGAEDPSTVDLLTRLLEYAAVVMASDIHVEPYEYEALIRYRMDGVLHEVLTLAPTALPALVTRIKILAGLRIDERRVPQDGRFEADLSGFKIDLRVSTLPTMWGEKVVMRVLSKQNIPLTLENLGLVASDHAIVLRHILRPFGMILLTGPTGSGKTTSLYAMIMQVGAERLNVVNISTIEDPIEYTIPRVNQVQVNPAAGLEFASGLKALLRQDPDIIMVGEIRDYETAEIAVRTALVGRLLFSTLHTNDATGAIPRLLDIGVEPYLIASTLALVVAQRLVRRICVHCRESIVPDEMVLKSLRARPDFESTIRILQAQGVLGKGNEPLTGIRFFQGKGCQQCHGSGFRGRMGVFEVLEIDDHLRSLIMERRDNATVRAAAVERGMKTMFQDGLAKVFLGETTLEEVYRAAV
ncbi:MAG TPA: GspE/PulE family protein [Candidatus Tectomicrobia bacterium]|jgi:type II secretory ATPase GspE/PulE/Tfp pilus assembly ATPase PilB-like protein